MDLKSPVCLIFNLSSSWRLVFLFYTICSRRDVLNVGGLVLRGQVPVNSKEVEDIRRRRRIRRRGFWIGEVTLNIERPTPTVFLFPIIQYVIMWIFRSPADDAWKASFSTLSYYPRTPQRPSRLSSQTPYSKFQKKSFPYSLLSSVPPRLLWILISPLTLCLISDTRCSVRDRGDNTYHRVIGTICHI